MVMDKFWDKLRLPDLRQNFDADTLISALKLYMQKQIFDLELSEDGVLSGVVSDGPRSYRATVVPRKDVLNMTCECGRMIDGPCEHVLALMIAWVGVDDLEEMQDVAEFFNLPKENKTPAIGVNQISLFPVAGPESIHNDWTRRLMDMTVGEMREMAAGMGVKLKGTLRDQVLKGLVAALGDPQKITHSVESLQPDARRLLDVLCILPGASPEFTFQQIRPYLSAALEYGGKPIELSDRLQELRENGLYLETPYSAFYPVPLQVVAYPFASPELFKPFKGQPQRASAVQPFRFTRLALRLLLLAQGGRLRCAPRPGGKNIWFVPANAEKGGSEIEIYPEPPYLEAGLRAGLAGSLGLEEAEVDLAARLLEEEKIWGYRAPEKPKDRLASWLRLSPQEQSRQLFYRLVYFSNQFELDLSRKAGCTPMRSQTAIHKAFLDGLGHARLRLARLLSRMPAGQWYEIDSVLRVVHGLQPGWNMEFTSRQTDPYSARIWQNANTWANTGRKRADPLKFEEWRQSYGQFYLAAMTGSLAWLGMLEIGWQDDRPAAVRLADFGEFLVGRRVDYPLPEAKTGSPALAARPDGSLELDLDSASLELINLLLRIAAPEAGKPGEFRKLVYRIQENGLGQAFEAGWTLEGILASLETAAGKALPPELVERLRPLWENFGRLQIYEDMTLIEFADDFCLPELLAATSLSQILVTTFSPRLVAVRTEAAADFVNELQAKGYTPHHEGV
jgi:hypothetical protein